MPMYFVLSIRVLASTKGWGQPSKTLSQKGRAFNIRVCDLVPTLERSEVITRRLRPMRWRLPCPSLHLMAPTARNPVDGHHLETTGRRITYPSLSRRTSRTDLESQRAALVGKGEGTHKKWVSGDGFRFHGMPSRAPEAVSPVVRAY
jgi:hypothetical protein